MRTEKYGAKLRRAVKKIKKQQKAKYECPKCGKKKIVRIAYALWQCRSCKVKIAGGAYTLTTETGEISLSRINSYGG